MPLVRRGGYGAIAGIFLAVVFGIVMTIIWRNSIIECVANPIASTLRRRKGAMEPKPQYSIAMARSAN